jgi:hypothetical protein
MEERRRNSDHVLDELKESAKSISHTVNQIYTKQEVIKEKVERIERETIKTNGRVTNLESWRDNKTGEFRIICWISAVLVTAVIGAWVKILIP